MRKGVVFTDTQQPNSDYMSCWFPEDDEGHSFELDTWFEYNHGSPSSVTNATLESFTTTGGAKKQGPLSLELGKEGSPWPRTTITPALFLVSMS